MTEFLVIGLKQQLSKIDNSSLNTIHSARNCGFIFDENLTFSDQSSSLSTSCDSPSLPPLSTLNFRTAFTDLLKSQINRLQQIQNCLARTVVKAPKSSHSTISALAEDQWTQYKLLSLTYKVLMTSQSNYIVHRGLHLISVQSTGRTRSSSLVTLARPSVSSSLQITNRSFRYASPYLSNQLPSSFRQPHSVHSPPGSPHPARITPSQSPLSFSPSITPSAFHSRLKTPLNHKSFPP